MWKKRHSRNRRREFLLESRETNVHGRKYRNRFLNFLRTILALRHWGKRFFRTSALITTIFVLISVFVIVAIFSPYFDLKKISFAPGNPTLDITKIENELSIFLGKNLILLSKKEIQGLLKEKFPEFREVEINEKWPSTIELKIKTSPPFANILDNETANFWVVSEDGILLAKQANESLPIIKMYGHTKPLVLKQKFLEGEKLKSIFIAKDLLEKSLGFKTKEIVFISVAEEVHLITDTGIAIWIDLNQDITGQIKKLAMGMKKIKINDPKKPLEHIDLRIPDQIFWK